MWIHKSCLRFVIIVATGIALFPFLPVPTPVAADGTVTDCTNDSKLSALLPQGGTILFNCIPSGAYTITVGSTKVITISVSIDGTNSGNPIVLSGGGTRRIFSINAGVTVSLTDMTVTGGRALSNNGGNISNAGTLNLAKVTVSNGRASPTTLGVNGLGGGIYNASTGTLNISQSTIYSNTAVANLNGGGMGGGIYNAGSMSIVNSTISGNHGDIGGGISIASGTSSLLNGTVVSNTAITDGADLDATGSVTLTNTILAGGGGADC